MVFDHSDGDDLAYLAEILPSPWCPVCHGEGEVEQPIRQDYFGNWDTKTYRCTACDGTGRATEETV